MKDVVFVKKKDGSALGNLSVLIRPAKNEYLRVQPCKFERLRWRRILAPSTNLLNRLQGDTPVMSIKSKDG